MQQCAGERQPLLESQGQGPCVPPSHGTELEHFDHSRDTVFTARTGEAVNASKELEVLAHRKFPIEREFLRHVAQTRTRLGRGAAKIDTRHVALAACRPQQAAQHFKRGGLARTVRAEQTEDLPRTYLEGDVFGGSEGAELFCQSACLDNGLVACGDHAHSGCERRVSEMRSAQKIDERIFKARRSR